MCPGDICCSLYSDSKVFILEPPRYSQKATLSSWNNRFPYLFCNFCGVWQKVIFHLIRIPFECVNLGFVLRSSWLEKLSGLCFVKHSFCHIISVIISMVQSYSIYGFSMMKDRLCEPVQLIHWNPTHTSNLFTALG